MQSSFPLLIKITIIMVIKIQKSDRFYYSCLFSAYTKQKVIHTCKHNAIKLHTRLYKHAHARRFWRIGKNDKNYHTDISAHKYILIGFNYVLTVSSCKCSIPLLTNVNACTLIIGSQVSVKEVFLI